MVNKLEIDVLVDVDLLGQHLLELKLHQELFVHHFNYAVSLLRLIIRRLVPVVMANGTELGEGLVKRVAVCDFTSIVDRALLVVVAGLVLWLDLEFLLLGRVEEMVHVLLEGLVLELLVGGDDQVDVADGAVAADCGLDLGDSRGALGSVKARDGWRAHVKALRV